MATAGEIRFRILSLDGGGAKGFYTLGVLQEVEAMLARPLCKSFDLIFGTSTGSIIGAMLALGHNVTEILKLYRTHVPAVMGLRGRAAKSARLAQLSKELFGDLTFADVKTAVGIVTTKWVQETPMIFKASVAQAHGRASTFVPGFGVPLGEAVEASCSAFPYFEKKTVTVYDGSSVVLFDGGYCANNPTLYAIADAVRAFQAPRETVRVLNVGVGGYPEPKVPVVSVAKLLSMFPTAQVTQKTFNVNTQSMEQLRLILFGDTRTVRVSEAFTTPEMATDMFECDMDKLNLIYRRGRESFGKQEAEIGSLLS